MLTSFGKEIRKERIERNWNLNDMAKLLDISPAYLSHMEMGRRPVSDEIINRLAAILNYHDVKKARLRRLADDSYYPDIIKIHSEQLKNSDKDLVQMFARRFETLDEKDKEKMKKILSKNREQESEPNK